jgi:hypothetical protein
MPIKAGNPATAHMTLEGLLKTPPLYACPLAGTNIATNPAKSNNDIPSTSFSLDWEEA